MGRAGVQIRKQGKDGSLGLSNIPHPGTKDEQGGQRGYKAIGAPVLSWNPLQKQSGRRRTSSAGPRPPLRTVERGGCPVSGA